MDANLKGQGRGNPCFGPILSWLGYFHRTHTTSDQPEDSDTQYEVRSTRNKEGKWKIPEEIAEESNSQWILNNAKVKIALAKSFGSQSTPWGAFTEPSSNRQEREKITRVHFQNVRGINCKPQRQTLITSCRPCSQ